MALAQDCKLKGIVQDENGIAVTDASVSAFDKNNQGKGFVFTNNQGEFEISLPCNETYEIEIDQPGFQLFVKKFELDKTKTERIRLLKGETISLQETIIKAQQAIKVKGDTIEYDADSFKVGNEEVLEDILKKLPGIEVENGKVYHKGKEIKNITVGGREVLGGNTKLLNKNLPSDAVSKIQLNTKFKSNPFSSSLQEDEQASLNIELKEDMKQLAFGNVTMGGDAQEHSDLQSKTFFFSEKTDATLIADFNTYGKEVFDRDDYFSFFGGMSEFTAEGSSFSLRNGISSLGFMGNTNTAEMNTFNGAAHFGYEPSKKMMISGFGLLNTNNLRYNSKVERFYNAEENPYSTLEEQRNKNNILSGMARLRIDYSPTANAQVKYRLNLNYLGNDDEQLINTYKSDNEATSVRENFTNRKNYNLAQNISYIRRIGKNNNIGFYIRHQYQEETPDLTLNSTVNPFSIFGNLTEQNGVYNLTQDQKYTINTLQLYSVYNHLVTNTFNVKLKAGTNFSFQDFGNNIRNYDRLIDLGNSVTKTDFDYNETFADVNLTKKIGGLQIDAGTGLHYFSETANFYDRTSVKNSETRLLPHANIKYNFNNATSISTSYNQSYAYPNARDLSATTVLQNYFSIFEGNSNLQQALTHNASLNFNHFNSFSFLSIFGSINYNLREKNIQTSSLAELTEFGVAQKSSLLNSDFNEKSYSTNWYISKRFVRWYNVRLNANISYSDFHTYIQRKNNTGVTETNSVNNTSVSQNYTLTNTFTLRKKLELKAGLNTSLSSYDAETSVKFENWRPFGELAWSINDNFLFQTDISYRLQYRDKEKINEAKELNASLRYKMFKKTYITFVAGNIFGNNVIVNNSANTQFNYIQTTTTDVLGRYFLVNLRYKF